MTYVINIRQRQGGGQKLSATKWSGGGGGAQALEGEGANFQCKEFEWANALLKLKV